jgi:hypothetical protein
MVFAQSLIDNAMDIIGNSSILTTWKYFRVGSLCNKAR